MASGLLSLLNEQVSVRYVSVSQLSIGKKYKITHFENVDTKYGLSTKCSLSDETEGEMEVYLPKSVHLTDQQISGFNNGRDEIFLVYHGMNGRAFKISFE